MTPDITAVSKPNNSPARLATITDPYAVLDFDRIAAIWIPLSVALNSIHHSMGERDLYPFILTPAITAKLAYVHQLITRQV